MLQHCCGGSQVNLLTNVTYSGVGGAAGHITSANLANGAYSYSASVALDGSGTPTASQLYAPYGSVCHANGMMPTDYGFTGRPSVASCRAVWPPAAPRDRAA